MKRSLISAALLVAGLAAGPAFAQDQQHPGGPGGGAPHPTGGQPHQTGGGPHTGGGAPGGGMSGMPGMGGQTMSGGGAPQVSGHHRTGHGGPPQALASTGGHNPGSPGPGHFAYQGQSHARIHGPTFHYPAGYHYRRWGAGQFLPRLFLTSAFFFTDYADYGFGPPPFGDAWVRYGPDLLLVNIATGQIVDVIYGAFY